MCWLLQKGCWGICGGGQSVSSEVADGVELGGNAGVNMWCRWQEYWYQVLQRGLNVAWQSNSRKDEVCGPGAFFRRPELRSECGCKDYESCCLPCDACRSNMQWPGKWCVTMRWCPLHAWPGFAHDCTHKFSGTRNCEVCQFRWQQRYRSQQVMAVSDDHLSGRVRK